MATIEKLKRQRMQFMRDQVAGIDSDTNCELVKSSEINNNNDNNNNYCSSKLSSGNNTVTTMTLETH